LTFKFTKNNQASDCVYADAYILAFEIEGRLDLGGESWTTMIWSLNKGYPSTKRSEFSPKILTIFTEIKELL